LQRLNASSYELSSFLLHSKLYLMFVHVSVLQYGPTKILFSYLRRHNEFRWRAKQGRPKWRQTWGKARLFM